MARHARIQIDIWDNVDFISLRTAEQQTYFLLMSHKTLSRCGVLMNIPSHFEGNARDLTAAKFRANIKALKDARFVVTDDRTHELLVRTYVRHDGVFDRENMGKAVGTAFETVVSPRIKKAIGAELHRLMTDRPELPGWKGLAATSPTAHAMATGMESRMQ